MKRFFILLSILIPFFVYSQKHIEFLGLPLNGTISTFTTKLKNKGFTLHPYNNEAPKGERIFNGTFFRKKAQIQIYYNIKNNIVYKGRAIIDFNDRESAKSFIKEILSGLESKYGDGFDGHDESDLYFSKLLYDRNTESENDGNLGLYFIGWVEVYLNYFSNRNVYTVYIAYTDFKNERANKKGMIDDL